MGKGVHSFWLAFSLPPHAEKGGGLGDSGDRGTPLPGVASASMNGSVTLVQGAIALGEFIQPESTLRSEETTKDGKR